jgi:hypothetical protein
MQTGEKQSDGVHKVGRGIIWENIIIIILFIGLAYQGKNIVFRFVIEYSSLRDFGP